MFLSRKCTKKQENETVIDFIRSKWFYEQKKPDAYVSKHLA